MEIIQQRKDTIKPGIECNAKHTDEHGNVARHAEVVRVEITSGNQKSKTQEIEKKERNRIVMIPYLSVFVCLFL